MIGQKCNCKYQWGNLAHDLSELNSIGAVARKYGCRRGTVQHQIKVQGLNYITDLTKCEHAATRLGRKAELESLSILPGAIDINAVDIFSPYDVLWGNTRINVKATSGPNKGISNLWVFNIGKGRGKCDFFLFMLYKNDVLQKAYLVPDSFVTSNHYSINIAKHNVYRLQVYPKK